MNTTTISILSLIVAGLAVFVGPIVSYIITNRQIKFTISISKKQIISPIRQEWINELRLLIAEITSRAVHYYVSGTENRKNSDYYRLTELEHTIKLYINPQEEDHLKLTQLIRQMTTKLYSTKFEEETMFWEAYNEILTLSQTILKREWERVKNDI